MEASRLENGIAGMSCGSLREGGQELALKQEKSTDGKNASALLRGKVGNPRFQRRSFTRDWLERLLGIRLGHLQKYRPTPIRLPVHYRRLRTVQTDLSISIVTPSYNQGRYLERTIQSVLNQNYPRLEYVVQDGGSSDESSEILIRYEDKLTHWESRKDDGQAHAINLGFQHAHGEVLAFLNSDDLLLPGALSYVADFFAANPEIDVVYGHRILIDETDQELNRWILPPHDGRMLSWADYIPQETLFWRRRIWEKVGGKLDESFHFALDWDLLLRFRDAGARFVRLPRFLGAFRIHDRQKTATMMWDACVPESNRLYQRYAVKPRYRYMLPYLLRHAFYQRLYQLGVIRY
jgi:glycosyltransferase involved in cell wall biosynthesis